MARKVLVAWSGGKDSVMALDLLLKSPDWEVVGLLTTVTSPYDRISMHGVRRKLLLEQALSLQLPLEIVWLEPRESDESYEIKMANKLKKFMGLGIRHVAFGDIFLEELRLYRERSLSKLGMGGLFPLWGASSSEVIRNFSRRGFQALITCVDTSALDGSFLGRKLDESLLEELPPQVDPCGENGEFHSFVYGGPLFNKPVSFRLGKVVAREGGRFLFQDLLPGK